MLQMTQSGYLTTSTVSLSAEKVTQLVTNDR